LVKLTEVTKEFVSRQGVFTVLKGINFYAAAGEIVGIIGPSGAGKSTLIRIINGLERPTSGSVIIAGEETAHYNERQFKPVRRKIGMIFQHFNLLSVKNARYNVALPLIWAGVKRREALARADELLELVGLKGRERHYAHELSGGQRQRVAIARALAHNPQVLLCDEATSALDGPTTDSILTLLQQLNRKLGVTIIMVAHDMHVIERVCHRAVIMQEGQTVEEGRLFDLFTRPQTLLSRELIRNVIDHDFTTGISTLSLLEAYQPDSDLILKIFFLREQANEPIISMLTRRLDIDISIISGNIDRIGGELFGALLVRVKGSEEQFEQVLNLLRSMHITYEEAGYADR
jgi:D-methionine transport system ATP-binding protein